MPKVDPESGQMLSDDPDQDDAELAGGETGGGFQHDHSDTGHHSPIDASPGGNDEGASASAETQGNEPGEQAGSTG